MSRVYAIASAKGGVGKTTTAANLGTVLSMAGHDVVVVDGDLGMPNLAGALGVDPDGKTLHDVLTGETTVESAIYEGPEGLSVVPGSTALEAFASANAKDLSPVIETLRESYDIVLIDTGAGLSDDTFVPLKLADEVLLVSTTEREALGDTEKTRQLGERIGADVVGVVLTRVNQSNPNADEVASRLDAGVIAVVPEDASIREALSTQIPVVARSADSIAAAGYRALAEALTGEPVPVPERDDDEVDETDTDADETDTDADETDTDAEVDADGQPATDADPADTEDTDTPADDEVSVVQTNAAAESPATDDTQTGDESEATDDVPLDTASEPVDDAAATRSPAPESATDQPTAAEPTPDDQSTPPAEGRTPESEAVGAQSLDTEPSPSSTPDDEPEPSPEHSPTQSVEPDDGTATGVTVNSDDDTATEATVEQTLEAEAEATLDGETDTLDGAIPFGSDGDDAAETGADDPLATESPAVDDPVTANLDDTDSMGPDPLAGDAVDETTEAPDISANVAAADSDDASPATDEAPATSAAGRTDDPTPPPASDTDDADASPASETRVVQEAPSDGADEPLVAEAEPDSNAEQSAVDSDDDEGAEESGDGEGVYTTSLVEEVETLENDDDEDEKKGFLSRFLG